MHRYETPALISKDKLHSLAYAFLRLCFYAAIIGVDLLIIYYDAENKGVRSFRESSLTEYTQEFFLFISSIIFFYHSRKNPEFKHLGFCVSASLLLLLIREFDGVFDKITHGFWKVPAIIVILILLQAVVRHRTALVNELVRFTEHRAFGTLLTGLLIGLLFSALFGHGELWKIMLDDSYIRVVKRAVQEVLELLGYSFLLISACEYFFIKKN